MALTTHQNRRYQCTYCTKSYKRMENLQVHKKHHEEETNPVPAANPAILEAEHTHLDLLATPYMQEYTGKPPPNTDHTPAVAGPSTTLTSGHASYTACETARDFDTTPTILGFEDLLELDTPIRTESEDEALGREIIEGATAFVEEISKEKQLERNLDTLPPTRRMFHWNWETPKNRASHDKLYNHHKVLIFACYKLYKYIDHKTRKTATQ